MAKQDKIWDLACKEIFVGLSAAVGVTVLPNQSGSIFKASTVGGTLWIGGASLYAGGSYGYCMAANETINIDFIGTAYFIAAGATAKIQVLQGID